jgi:hypothetical protein
MEKNKQEQTEVIPGLIEGRDYETGLTLHGRANLQAQYSLLPEVEVNCACRKSTMMKASEKEVSAMLYDTVKVTDNLYRTIEPCYKCGVRFFILVFNSIFSW